MFAGQDLLKLAEHAMRDIRGSRIAMVFQDPMTSLNPVRSIGQQMVDIQHRNGIAIEEKRRKASDALTRVGIPDAGHATRQFSLSVLRRHAPTHRHRHGASAAAGVADCGRGDNGA